MTRTAVQRHPDPLRAGVYLRRRFRQLAPQWLAMGLVTALLIMVVTPMNSFRETIRANQYLMNAFTVVTPYGEPAFDSTLTALLERNPSLERQVPVKVAWVRYPMLIGETFCPLILTDPAEGEALVTRLGLALVEGRFPHKGRREIVLHEDVAHAKRLAVGDRVGPVVERTEVGGMFEIVGLLRGPGRIAIGTIGTGLGSRFLDARLPAYVLVYARPGGKAASDAYLRGLRTADTLALQVVDAEYVRARTEEALKNLPVLAAFLTLVTSGAVAVVVVLLNLMAFQARADEFAVLLAVGQPRSRLARKIAAECGLLAGVAWILGVSVGIGAMMLYARYALGPRGIVMQPLDPRPLALSLSVPIIAAVTSVAVLWRRLRGLDPVAVIERRFI